MKFRGIFLLLFTLFSLFGYSQYCGTATSNVAITPTTTSQLTASYSTGIRAFNFTAVAGCVYEFSTCSQSTVDTYLRLYSTGTGGTLLASNDDFCSKQSTLTWTSTVNGTVSILLTRFSCNALNAATKMSYRRISCSVPSCATLIAPTNGLTGTTIGQTLSWNPINIATSYDVYFGTNSSPPLVTNQTGTTYNPGTLSYNTTYYWKIIPKNSNGSATGCSTWSFTTSGPGCLSSPNGQYPTSIFNPSCNGSPQTISTLCYAGEYSVVSLLSGINYTFSSSISTDYITISDELGTTVLAYGTGSVSYQPTSNANYRFYTHTNNLCGSNTTARSRIIQCSAPPPPSNDNCSGAIDVGICGGTFNGSTQFSTNGDGPDCGSAPSETWTSPGVWYKVTGNGQNVTVSLCGSNFDTKVHVYTGVCGTLTCLTTNDDFCSLQSEVTFSSTVGTTYYILVTGYGSSRGAFTLNVSLVNSPPTITTQPVSQNLCIGDTKTLSVIASGVQGPFSYQWYLNGNPISNTNTTSINVSTGGNYVVTVTNSCGSSTTSNVAIVTSVQLPIPSLTSYASTICAGGSGTNTLTSSVTSGTPTYTYQWQYFNSSWLNTGTNSTTLNATPTLTREYRVIVTDVNGCKGISPSHTVTVVPDPINPTLNTKTPNTNDVCKGVTLKSNFNSGSDGVGCSDQFQYSTNGTTWTNYTPNDTISTYNLSDGALVQIRGKRGSCVSGIGCSNNSWDILSTWTVRYQPITSIVSTNVGCYLGSDGIINLTPQGYAPFTYSWSNGNTTEDIINLTVGTYSVQVIDFYGCTSTNSTTITQPTNITITAVKQNVNCYGMSTGAIYLTVNGGTQPYSYLWNNGIATKNLTNITAGSYTCTVTDYNGCTQTYSTTISQNTQIVLTTTKTDVNCSGGSNGTASVSPLGGTPPYSYNWSNGSTSQSISNLFAGTYNVIVTDSKGCSKSSFVSVTQPNPISVSLVSITNEYCGTGGNVDVNVIGGISPYSYNWSNGSLTQDLTNVLSGNYVLGVYDANGCPTNFGVNVGKDTCNEPQIVGSDCGLPLGAILTYSISNAPNSTCVWTVPYGVSIYSGQGTTTFKIKYSTYFVGGLLTATVTTPTQTYYLSKEIIKNPKSPYVINGNNSVCANNTTIYEYYVDSVSTATGYIWNLPNGAILIDGQGNDTIHVKFNTTFINGSINVQSYNQCGSSPMTYYNIQNNNQSVFIGVISGPGDLCPYLGSTTSYSVSLNQGYTYTWTVPLGITIISGQGTNIINVQVSNTFTSGVISVKMNEGCGDSQISNKQLTTTQTTISVSNINGLTNVCNLVGTGQTTTYSITPITGVNYTWSVPSGCTIVNGQNSNLINVSFQVGFNGGVISVTVSGCTSPITKNLTLSTTTPIIGSISGPTCIENNTSYSYNVSPIQGAISYSWTPPGNATIVSGQGTNSIMVNYPLSFESSICLNNLCDSLRLSVQFNCGIGKKSVRIGMTTYPVTTITGPSSTCPPDTIQLSASTSFRATNYIWGKPNGTQWVNLTGLTQPNVGQTVNSSINTTFLGGNYSVQAYNQCGSTAMRYFTVSKSCANRLMSVDTTETPTQNLLDFVIYPNPNKGEFMIKILDTLKESYLVTVTNNLGQIFYSDYKKSEDIIKLSILSSGIYFVHIKDNLGNKTVKTLFIFE